MAQDLEPIDPLQYISEHMPPEEGGKNVASWFKTEAMELNFGEYTGRPSENIQVHQDTLSSLFQQGWYVTAVKLSASEGEWQRVSRKTEDSSSTSQESSRGSSTKTGSSSVSGTESSTTDKSSTSSEKSSAESTAVQDASSASTSDAASRGESESDARATNDSSSHSTTNTYISAGSSRTTATGTGTNSATGSNSNSGTETATGTSHSSGREVSTGESSGKDTEHGTSRGTTKKTEKSDETNISEEVVSKEGVASGVSVESLTDPYWCAYALIRLERRRMQPDAVLQSMIDSFVATYNWGRKVNVERYDEIVALYALMLSRTEDEANALLDDDIDFGPLFDRVRDAIEGALANYREVADSLPDDWLKSRRDEINLKFDALVAETKAKMVDAGTYNGTVWPGTEAAIERQRQYALNALKDDVVKLRLDAYKDIATVTADVQNNLVNAQVRIFEALQKQKLEPTNLRNTVLKWMLDFMAEREDEYPGLADMETIAERLGYTGGIAAPTSVVS